LRRAFVLGLVVVGLAAVRACADDSNTPKRPSWHDLHAEYERVHKDYLMTRSEILATRDRLHAAEAVLAPLRATEAQLVSTCVPGDPKIAAQRKVIYDTGVSLKLPETQNRLVELTKMELDQREVAITAGDDAQQGILRYIERTAQMMGGGAAREQQVKDAREKYLALCSDLDKLEGEPGSVLPAFKPNAVVPALPRQIDWLIKLYTEQAGDCDAIAGVLSHRIAAKRIEKDHLEKIDRAGYKMEGLQARLDALDARFEELRSAHSVATKRASDLRAEIGRLERRKAELEK
jgi:hypothetical protein